MINNILLIQPLMQYHYKHSNGAKLPAFQFYAPLEVNGNKKYIRFSSLQ